MRGAAARASRRLPADATGDTPRYRSIRQSPVLVLIVIMLTLAAAETVAYLEARRTVTTAAGDNLAAIAALKTNQITDWLAERQNDAKVVSKAPSFAADLQQWLQDGRPGGAHRERLRNYLQVFADTAHYRDVSIHSAEDGSELLASGENHEDTPAVTAQARRSAQLQQAIMEDIHFHRAGSQDVDLAWFAPISGRDARPIAVLHLTVDPVTELFPLLRHRPGSNPSAETLLLRREGDAAVVLGSAPEGNDGTFGLRQPLTGSRSILAQAVDHSGVLNGVDYRGVASLGYALPVPGTPWFVLARMDRASVHAHLDRMAFHNALIFTLLLLAGAWWLAERHRHELAHYLQRMERNLLSERLDFLARHANDSIVLCDQDERIIEVNDRAMTMYGYTRDEMVGMSLAGLRTPAAPGIKLNELDVEQGVIFETEHRRKDGRILPVEVSVRSLSIDGARYVKEIIRDITGHKKAAARIERLSRLYAAISRTNQAIIYGTSLPEVYRAVCQACVDIGRFKLAWIGIADAETRNIVPVASAGAAAGYVDGLVLSIADDIAARHGPTARAYREQRICRTDFRSGPANDRAALHGLTTSVALPLRRGAKPYGALTVYGNEKDSIDDNSLTLLGEMVDNISFFIDHLDREAQRAEAETALRRSEARLQHAQSIGNIGDWELDLEAETLMLSPEMFRILQRDPARGPPSLDEVLACYGAPIDEQKKYLREVAANGVRTALESRVALPDGRTAHHAIVLMPGLDAAGRPMLFGTIQDVTERKQLERERAASAERVQLLSRRLVAVQEEERRRLVDDLHDHASPNLAAIHIILSTLQKTLPADALAAAAASLEDAQALLADTTLNMRDLCADLRPSLLDYTGLVAALESYAHQFGRRTGVTVQVETTPRFPRLPPDIESPLFRIAQEAFTNSLKHGHAKKIRLALACRGGGISLTVSDDGSGFDPAALGRPGQAPPGLGLITLRERAEFIGGTLAIRSRPGHGTTIVVALQTPDGALDADTLSWPGGRMRAAAAARDECDPV